MAFLLEEESWEDAFALIRNFALHDHIERLVTATFTTYSTEACFHDFRIRQVRPSVLEESAVLDLATAELMFRSGFHERSFLLAEAAGRSSRKATTWVREHFAEPAMPRIFLTSETRQSTISHSLERRRSLSRTTARHLWGLFLAVVEQEDDAAAALLADYENLQATGGDDLLRLQNGRLHLGMRLGSVVTGLHGAEAVADVVSEARDPTVRAAFWHVYAGALRLAARYDEALAASDRAIEEIEEFDLRFARSYLATTRALVYMGLSTYDEASAELDLAAKLAARTGDAYIDLSTRAGRCRLLLLVRSTRGGRRVHVRRDPSAYERQV